WPFILALDGRLLCLLFHVASNPPQSNVGADTPPMQDSGHGSAEGGGAYSTGRGFRRAMAGGNRPDVQRIWTISDTTAGAAERAAGGSTGNRGGSGPAGRVHRQRRAGACLRQRAFPHDGRGGLLP